jgi:hypothetical protein
MASVCVSRQLWSNYGSIPGGLGDKRKATYQSPQSIFPPFCRKVLIGVWCYNLGSPLKATSIGHPRDTEARPLSTKKDEDFFLVINRVKVLPNFQ